MLSRFVVSIYYVSVACMLPTYCRCCGCRLVATRPQGTSKMCERGKLMWCGRTVEDLCTTPKGCPDAGIAVALSRKPGAYIQSCRPDQATNGHAYEEQGLHPSGSCYGSHRQLITFRTVCLPVLWLAVCVIVVWNDKEASYTVKEARSSRDAHLHCKWRCLHHGEA